MDQATVTKLAAPTMNQKLLLRAGAVCVALVSVVRLGAEPLGRVFTYQGRLNEGSRVADGLYDFQFALRDAPAGGNSVGPNVTQNGISVSNGLFSVVLDFGDVFNGTALWLELSVRTNGGSGFTVLAPRQALTPAPNASYAANSGSAQSARLAGLAQGVMPGSITSDSLAPGAVTPGALAPTTFGALTQGGSGSAGLAADGTAARNWSSTMSLQRADWIAAGSPIVPPPVCGPYSGFTGAMSGEPGSSLQIANHVPYGLGWKRFTSRVTLLGDSPLSNANCVVFLILKSGNPLTSQYPYQWCLKLGTNPVTLQFTAAFQDDSTPRTLGLGLFSDYAFSPLTNRIMVLDWSIESSAPPSPVKSLDNGLALRPMMGWAPWNTFHTTYDESTVVGITDAMATNGMRDAGYKMISIDVGWMAGRDTNGTAIVNSNRFPHGLAWLANYVRSKGFDFGIYSTACTNGSPGGDPTGLPMGSVFYETNDAALWASWGAKYLKYDFMGSSPLSIQQTAERMRNALLQYGGNIVYMLSGAYFTFWKREYANQWRVGEDIGPTWASVLHNLDQSDNSALYQQPGSWNDPDMLEVGVGSELTDTEQCSHFTLWCVAAAPLIAGNDMRTATPATLGILSNSELIAVDQDANGVQGRRVSSTPGQNGNLEVWCKPLGTDGTAKAVALLNRGSASANMSVSWTNLLLKAGAATVRDLWLHSDLGTRTNSFTTNVPSHGVVALKIVGASAGMPVDLCDLPLYEAAWPTNKLGIDWFVKNSSVGGDRGDWYSDRQGQILNGVWYPKGIGVQAPSVLNYSLAGIWGRASRFVAEIGIDDEVAYGGSVVFQVMADGVLLYDSGVMNAVSPTQLVNLDVSGRRVLTLIVTDAGDGNANDQADWANARILFEL